MTVTKAKQIIKNYIITYGFPEFDVVVYEDKFDTYTFWGLIELIKNNR